jgi:putative membrane protein insertion efficiency factor
MKWALMLPVLLYRLLLRPFLPRACRFHPTCSDYALAALRGHGALRGGWLAARRLMRCHPFTEPGFDPVPESKTPPASSTHRRGHVKT